MKIAMLAKGQSIRTYPGPAGFDEVWGLNQLGKSHELDLLFVMDDLKLRMPLYDGPEFPEWLKSYPGRIITSEAYPEWPTSEAFPIQDVAKYLGLPLGVAMYCTPDYMLAYAIYKQVSEIHMYGVDCISKNMELVRTSIAFWIGAATSRGIKVVSSDGSFARYWTSAGRCMEEGLYGYANRPRIETLV